MARPAEPKNMVSDAIALGVPPPTARALAAADQEPVPNFEVTKIEIRDARGQIAGLMNLMRSFTVDIRDGKARVAYLVMGGSLAARKDTPGRWGACLALTTRWQVHADLDDLHASVVAAGVEVESIETIGIIPDTINLDANMIRESIVIANEFLSDLGRPMRWEKIGSPPPGLLPMGLLNQ